MSMTFAVDFDGCLCGYKFPHIGEQSEQQKELMNILKQLRVAGHRVILWTCRGEPYLQEAIAWCKDRGLEFDAVNINPFFQKPSGPSPKIVADFYIDDKALSFPGQKPTLEVLSEILHKPKE